MFYQRSIYALFLSVLVVSVGILQVSSSPLPCDAHAHEPAELVRRTASTKTVTTNAHALPAPYTSPGGTTLHPPVEGSANPIGLVAPHLDVGNDVREGLDQREGDPNTNAEHDIADHEHEHKTA